jgi:hypothetical protein
LTVGNFIIPGLAEVLAVSLEPSSKPTGTVAAIAEVGVYTATPRLAPRFTPPAALAAAGELTPAESNTLKGVVS